MSNEDSKLERRVDPEHPPQSSDNEWPDDQPMVAPEFDDTEPMVLQEEIPLEVPEVPLEDEAETIELAAGQPMSDESAEEAPIENPSPQSFDTEDAELAGVVPPPTTIDVALENQS